MATERQATQYLYEDLSKVLGLPAPASTISCLHVSVNAKVQGLRVIEAYVQRLERILGKLSRAVSLRAGSVELTGTRLEQLDAVGHLQDWAVEKTQASRPFGEKTT